MKAVYWRSADCLEERRHPCVQVGRPLATPEGAADFLRRVRRYTKIRVAVPRRSWICGNSETIFYSWEKVK